MSGPPEISLEDQVRWAEGVLARTRAYWNRQLQEERTRANPVFAALEIRRAEAVVATLKRLAQGGFG